MTGRLEPFGLAPDVLLEEDSAEFFEAGGRIIEGGEDRLPLVALQGEHLDVVGERRPQPRFELLVVDHPGQVEHEPVGDRKAGKEHASSVDAPGA